MEDNKDKKNLENLENLENSLDDILLDEETDSTDNSKQSNSRNEVFSANKWLNQAIEFVKMNPIVSFAGGLFGLVVIYYVAFKPSNDNSINSAQVNNIVQKNIKPIEPILPVTAIEPKSDYQVEKDFIDNKNIKNNSVQGNDKINNNLVIEPMMDDEENRWQNIENKIFDKSGERDILSNHELDKIVASIETLSKENSELKSELAKISHQNKNLSKNLSLVQQAILALENTSSKISNTMQKIDKELGKQLATFDGLDDIRDSLALKSKQLQQPDLVIHAIVPGRAWLKKHNGEIITVSEGDSIERYGKIVSINSQSNSIITSSGITLSR